MQSLNREIFLVPLGISHKELIEAAGGFTEEPEKLISGGPMMGFAMVTLDAPVTKTSSSLLAFKEDIVKRVLRPPALTVQDASMYVQAVSFHPDWQISPKGKMKLLLWHGMVWNVWNVDPAAMSVRQSVS